MSVSSMLAWLMCALIGAQAPDDASLNRIKAALRKPAPKLIIEAPKPDFRINVDAIRPFADLFVLPPWVTPPSDLDAPRIAGNGRVGQIGGFDPGTVSHAISKAIRTRRAHAEVIEAIRDYCAGHRNEPGAAGICGGPPR